MYIPAESWVVTRPKNERVCLVTSVRELKMTERPALVCDLENVFGVASSAAFGSTVFFDDQSSSGNQRTLEDMSIEKYRFFCGETWTKFGEDKWLKGWSELYHRSVGHTNGIVSELRSITVQPFRSCLTMFLDGNEDNDAVHQLLSKAFDGDGVRELRIFSLGDGEAMSGFLIASEMMDLGRLFLAFLMD